MKAAQAVWTMVAVVTASACRHNKPAAYFTGKAVMTRVGFIITFLILFSFVFSVHENILLKVVGNNPFGRLDKNKILRQPPG